MYLKGSCVLAIKRKYFLRMKLSLAEHLDTGYAKKRSSYRSVAFLFREDVTYRNWAFYGCTRVDGVCQDELGMFSISPLFGYQP